MTTPLIQPYLFFGGRCEEAFAFYAEAADAEICMLMRHRDNPEPAPPGMIPAGYEDKVLHGELRIGGSTLMASDGCGETEPFQSFSLALSVATEAEADRVFNALADGGEVTMPLARTFWSPRFGMLKDKFGLCWMVTVSAEEAA